MSPATLHALHAPPAGAPAAGPPPPRRDDWETRLHQAIEDHRHTPFRWGRHDCCLWAATAIHYMTGHDPAAHLRGAYHHKVGARLLIHRRYGGLHRIPPAHGYPAIDPRYARQGDILLIENRLGPTLAIHAGTHHAAAGARGLEFGRHADQPAHLAWQVPLQA